MKILILMAASMFGFGLAVQETNKLPQQQETVVVTIATPADLEQPVLDVLLDTVEISTIRPLAVASK